MYTSTVNMKLNLPPKYNLYIYHYSTYMGLPEYAGRGMVSFEFGIGCLLVHVHVRSFENETQIHTIPAGVRTHSYYMYVHTIYM